MTGTLSRENSVFFLDPDIPYLVSAHAELVVDRLLAEASLRRSDVSHWLVHSGGKKVIDAIRVNLGLTRHDLRHTLGVLRDYGNLSSGFSCSPMSGCFAKVSQGPATTEC